jgi:hypothetical protein
MKTKVEYGVFFYFEDYDEALKISLMKDFPEIKGLIP